MSAQEIGVRCGDRFSTYPQLFDRALRATRGLHELGLGAGDRVALLLRNSIELLEASIATVPLGASAVPINWHWRGDEVAYVLGDSGAKALLAHADLWRVIADAVPEGVALVLLPGEGGDYGGELPAGALGWPDWIAARQPRAEAPERAPMSIIYTSGTTGRPKGVVRTPVEEEQREAMSVMLRELFRLGPDERTVIPARPAPGAAVLPFARPLHRGPAPEPPRLPLRAAEGLMVRLRPHAGRGPSQYRRVGHPNHP